MGRGSSCLSIGQKIFMAFLGATSDRQSWQIVCKQGSFFGSSVYSSPQTGHRCWLFDDGRLSFFAFWKNAIVQASSILFDVKKKNLLEIFDKRTLHGSREFNSVICLKQLVVLLAISEMFNFLIVRTNHSSALFLLFCVKFVVFKLLRLIKPDNPSLFLNLMKKGAFEKEN